MTIIYSISWNHYIVNTLNPKIVDSEILDLLGVKDDWNKTFFIRTKSTGSEFSISHKFVI